MKKLLAFFVVFYHVLFFQNCIKDTSSNNQLPEQPIDTLTVVPIDTININSMLVVMNEKNYNLIINGMRHPDDSSKFSFAAQRIFAPSQNPDVGIGFESIPTKCGKYTVHGYHFPHEKPEASLSITDFDAILKYYQLDTTQIAWLEVDSIDIFKQTIQGRFEVHFLQQLPISSFYPEKIDLNKGRFKVKLGI